MSKSPKSYQEVGEEPAESKGWINSKQDYLENGEMQSVPSKPLAAVVG